MGAAMSFAKIVLLGLCAVAGYCYALPTLATDFDGASRMAAIYGGRNSTTTFGAVPDSTDCHGWDWFYCPRDPGCTSYKMSAHQVSVGKPGHTRMVVGNWVNLYVIGMTTITNVSEIASYKVYGISGGNVGSGELAARHGNYLDGPKGLGASLELNFLRKPGQFRLQIPHLLTAASFDESGTQFVNFGIDIFLTGKYVEEGMCVQLANAAYAKHESAKLPFEMECKDNGDGTFTKGVQPNALHKLGGCNEFHKECDGCMSTCNPQRSALLVDRNPFKLH